MTDTPTFHDLESAVAALGTVYNEHLYPPLRYRDDYDAGVQHVIALAAIQSVNSWGGKYMMMRAHRAADVASCWVGHERLSPDLRTAKVEAVNIIRRWFIADPHPMDSWNNGLTRLIKDVEVIPVPERQQTLDAMTGRTNHD